jgi:hypothetical protein
VIVSLIGQVLYTGYVVKLVQDVRDGRRDHTLDELFSAAAPYVGTLILNGFVYAVDVFFGFLALIVPGLILITIWAVVAPSIVLEHKGVFEAFGRSRELVRGNGWPVFGTIVLPFLIVVVGGVFSVIGASIGDAGRVILGTIGNILVVPVEALVAGILFFDLGAGEEQPARHKRRRRSRRSSQRRPRPPGRRGSIGRAVGALHGPVVEPAEQLREDLQLVRVERHSQSALDGVDVTGGGVAELRGALLGEDRVADPRIGLALALPDQALIHQAVE